MDNAISAIIAVAGTLLGAALTYLFQSRMSERAGASAFQRELRAERMSVYSSYATALTEFSRGQVDWYNRREEDPDSAETFAARVESYRLKGVAQAVLSQVQLVAGSPAVVTAANDAFELTRPVHYAQDSTDLRSRTGTAKKAVNSFVALAAAEIQSSPMTSRNHRTTTVDQSGIDTSAAAAARCADRGMKPVAASASSVPVPPESERRQN